MEMTNFHKSMDIFNTEMQENDGAIISIDQAELLIAQF